MTDSNVRPSRRQEILEALARELETHPGNRITTAGLAAAVGVSEAALYRHFASKAKMFEDLIGFAEDSVFGLTNRILSDEPDVMKRCQGIVQLLLGFSERNPGITRILVGDALVGENQRLRARVVQFFDRLEMQLKQVLREGALASGVQAKGSPAGTANLLVALAEGKMLRYVQSGFHSSPTSFWEEQWASLARDLFR
ncbi:MAG: nucleoid occlusion factor SlmA [Gammaproteobacteria bacterium]|nr:nucleoid occlusion factor SlmA [Gammaproteobacteria bacterium]